MFEIEHYSITMSTQNISKLAITRWNRKIKAYLHHNQNCSKSRAGLIWNLDNSRVCNESPIFGAIDTGFKKEITPIFSGGGIVLDGMKPIFKQIDTGFTKEIQKPIFGGGGIVLDGIKPIFKEIDKGFTGTITPIFTPILDIFAPPPPPTQTQPTKKTPVYKTLPITTPSTTTTKPNDITIPLILSGVIIVGIYLLR